jgi:alpha-beta hydrolase superfamily lysophospholipase
MQSLHTHDGLPLHLRQWAPAGPARGTVLIVHGLGEHIGRYAHVAAHLNAQGWHVAGYDQRGHGASGGARGVLPAADSLLQDLARVLDAVREQHPGRLVLLGHSMGGVVASRFVAEALATQPAAFSRPVEALVLSSPALDLGMNAVQKLLLAVAYPLAPRAALGNGLNAQYISRDPDTVKAYQADPLVHDRIAPGMARFMVDAGLHVRAAAPAWRVPTLLVYGGADRIISPAGSDAFAQAAPQAVVTARRYDALYHEIFNELPTDRAAVLAEVARWLDAQPARP